MVAILRKIFEKKPEQNWDGVLSSVSNIIPEDILALGKSLIKEHCETFQGFESTKTYFLGDNFYVREFIFDSYDNAMLAIQNDHIDKMKNISGIVKEKLLERNLDIPEYKRYRHVIIENGVSTYINNDQSINNEENNTN